MVDFNSDATIGTNRGQILDILILQRRDEFYNTYQEYLQASFSNKSNTQSLLYKLKSILMTISRELYFTLQRRMKTEFKDFLNELKEAKTLEAIQNSAYLIDQVLDNLNITKIDSKREYDRTRVENENAEKGL